MLYRSHRSAMSGILLIILLSAVGLVAACSSEGEAPVPPTALPTAPSDSTQTPGSPTATTPPATPTTTGTATASSTTPATATSEPDDLLYTMILLATGETDPNRYRDLLPGSSDLLDRAYPGAPPLVPHRAEDLVITPDKNSCMSCHEAGRTINGNTAVQVPISHYTDLSTGSVSGQLQGRRYVCTSCHVPQVIDEPPVVSSD